MNKFFEQVCIKLNLGSIINNVENIKGGITNKIYKVETTNGIYAIKIINEDNIKKDNKLLDRIEYSEEIANIVNDNGVNAICAIKFNNKYIQKINDNYILVYNWCNGKVLLTKELTLNHVKKVGSCLGKIHSIKVKTNKDYDKYKKIDYSIYYEILKNNKEEWCQLFINRYKDLLVYYEKIYNSYLQLSNQKSYVHCDLNRKNIMWNNDIPYIIDWETSKIGNPSIDFFNSAWFLTADVDKDKYKTFCDGYFKYNMLDDNFEIGVYVAIIDECNWLEYSLKRALSIQSLNIDEINLGKESIESSLTEILNYIDKIPLMLEFLKNQNL